jgi:hypothetical protein
MSQPADNHHYVRRVVLPSGKTIEVVYFDAGAVTEAQSPADSLHVCGGCSSHLVYPTDWEEAGSVHWEVSLRCPNCEWRGTGIFTQDAVEQFDEELDRGTDALTRDLRRLSHANMQDEIERFSSALNADHILPDDF